ncbi:MAG: helix-turn-helix domain-containing protein [Lentisphaerales bacterium]|nr:helix-turn-helix domain-containing protein [Lentisphaerales bacterium]
MSNISNRPDWFTIKEAADYLQIGEPTLYRWMRDGKITFRKIGDSTRFLQEDLDEVVVVHHSVKTLKNKPRCSQCGSNKIINGKCQSTGLLYFVPEEAKFWTFKTSTVGLKSSMCANCGHIQLNGDTEHLNNLLKQSEEEVEEIEE